MLLPGNKMITSTQNLLDEGEMEKRGIRRFPVDYFYYREYRYTTLKDAIAQAKRDETCHKRASVS